MSTVLLVMLGACSPAAPTLQDVLRQVEDAEGTAEVGWAGASDVDRGPVAVDAPTDEAEDEAEDQDDGHGPEPAEDPFVVPDPIDEAYVELVVNELLRVLSDALRAHLADEDPGGLRTEAVFREVYGDAQLEVRLDDLWQVFSTEDGRATQYPPEQFGVQRFEVLELARVQEDCITVLGLYDVTETSRFPYGDRATVFVISRDERFRSQTNRTSWRLWSASPAVTPDGEPYRLDELEAVDNLDELVDADCSWRSAGRGTP